MKYMIKEIARIILVTIILLLCCVDCEASPVTTNKALVQQTCKENYHNTNIKYIRYNSKNWEKIVLHRKGKKYIVVEKFISYSSGKDYGYSKEGYYIKYNKKVKKDKKVISYCIYSPYNNYCDGVDFVIDNRKVR